MLLLPATCATLVMVISQGEYCKAGSLRFSGRVFYGVERKGVEIRGAEAGSENPSRVHRRRVGNLFKAWPIAYHTCNRLEIC